MKRKTSFLFIAMLFSASLALAADSRGNRGDSLLLVGMSGGLHIASALTTPATLAVYLGESVLIGVESGSASS
ncbi:MAG: hypothetical protein GY866_12770, partial [Proteobacteria bacterium]|nr:hypothetical protein [Pseudomonadota bacterium]